MKISTKGRYGLRAMLDLALNSLGDHVALSNIAERQDISVSYLEQMFSVLRKAGLLKSVKGAQGGYVLADRPSQIKVGTILRALEIFLLLLMIMKQKSQCITTLNFAFEQIYGIKLMKALMVLLILLL